MHRGCHVGPFLGNLLQALAHGNRCTEGATWNFAERFAWAQRRENVAQSEHLRHSCADFRVHMAKEMVHKKCKAGNFVHGGCTRSKGMAMCTEKDTI